METATPKFSITREFEAPMKLVFEAFSTATALGQWWGPVEAPIEVIRLDFRPGGIFHYKMKGEHTSYGLFKYTQIEAPRSITWINSFANEQGEVIKPPFPGMDVPREIQNTITLSEENGITRLVLVCHPLHASPEEIATFNAITQSMEQGYGGTLGQLKTYLQTIKQ